MWTNPPLPGRGGSEAVLRGVQRSDPTPQHATYNDYSFNTPREAVRDTKMWNGFWCLMGKLWCGRTSLWGGSSPLTTPPLGCDSLQWRRPGRSAGGSSCSGLTGPDSGSLCGSESLTFAQGPEATLSFPWTLSGLNLMLPCHFLSACTSFTFLSCSHLQPTHLTSLS